MNNVLLIAYNGKKPSKADIEKIGELLMNMKFCNEIEMIKHYDQDSICDIIGRGATIIGFEPKKDEALENAATFVNAHFKSAWDMIGQIAIARQTTFKTKEQMALLNAVDIIAGKTQAECEKYGIPSIIHNACYNVKYHILSMD